MSEPKPIRFPATTKWLLADMDSEWEATLRAVVDSAAEDPNVAVPWEPRVDVDVNAVTAVSAAVLRDSRFCCVANPDVAPSRMEPLDRRTPVAESELVAPKLSMTPSAAGGRNPSAVSVDVDVRESERAAVRRAVAVNVEVEPNDPAERSAVRRPVTTVEPVLPTVPEPSAARLEVIVSMAAALNEAVESA